MASEIETLNGNLSFKADGDKEFIPLKGATLTLVRYYKTTIQERAKRDPAFAETLKNELEKENLNQI